MAQVWVVDRRKISRTCDLKRPQLHTLFLQLKALEVDSGNLIFARVQHRMSHAILLLCTALCQRGKKASICGASEQCTLARPTIPNLLQLSHSLVARLCRISGAHMTVSTAKLIKRVLQEPVAFRGCSFASSCSDMMRYVRYASYGFYPYLRILGFYSHADKVFIEEQISQEGLHCPDAACCVVCSAFVEVEPLLARHQRKESGDVV